MCIISITTGTSSKVGRLDEVNIPIVVVLGSGLPRVS